MINSNSENSIKKHLQKSVESKGLLFMVDQIICVLPRHVKDIQFYIFVNWISSYPSDITDVEEAEQYKQNKKHST